MATLTSLRVKRTKPANDVGQGRKQANRELYEGKAGANRRRAVLGRYVPKPPDWPDGSGWNSRPHAPVCVMCEAKAEKARQQGTPVSPVRQAQVVDHIVPVNQGGTDEPDNWQPLCYKCHNSKSGTERWTKKN